MSEWKERESVCVCEHMCSEYQSHTLILSVCEMATCICVSLATCS